MGFSRKHIPQAERKTGRTSIFIYFISIISTIVFLFLFTNAYLFITIVTLTMYPQSVLENIPNEPTFKLMTQEQLIACAEEAAVKKYPFSNDYKILRAKIIGACVGYGASLSKEEQEKMAFNFAQDEKQRMFLAENSSSVVLEQVNDIRKKKWKEAHRKWKQENSFMAADKQYHESVSTVLFSMAVLLLTLECLGGGKLCLVGAIRGTFRGFWKGSILFFGLYILTLILLKTTAKDSYNDMFVIGGTFLSLFGFIYPYIFWEIIKETRPYRSWFIEGYGREIARWAGFLSFYRHDISKQFRAARWSIPKLKKSAFYIGKTSLQYDFQLPGRHIGTTGEQHLMIVAGTGSGKSRDILNNNTLTYSGGMVIFDTKGEHVEISHKKRAEFAKTYVVDPWEKNKLGIPSAHWNPLTAIDINSKSARALIKRMCEAIIIKEGAEMAKDAHFREIPQKVLRGFIAHVLSTYDKKYHNLPSVYDLMFKGYIEGEEFDPDKNIVSEMEDNPVCQGAPIEAANLLEELEGSEKSGVWSTLSRSLDWVNDPCVRDIISGENSFSFKECKQEDATVYLLIPENFLEDQRRFVRLFYQVALDVMDKHETPQPKGHGRRVLFVFDEFESMGNFESARKATNTKRSSYIRCLFVVQNFSQFKANYGAEGANDFISNCDKIFFGIDSTDTGILERLFAALGKYTAIEYTESGHHGKENIRSMMSRSELSSFMDGYNNGLFYLPVQGEPFKMKRAHYDSNFWEHKRWIRTLLEGDFSAIKKIKNRVRSWKEKQV